MKETDVSRRKVKTTAHHFRVSEQPVVEANLPAELPSRESVVGLGEVPSLSGGDSLNVIARDPKTLFLCWDLDWAKLFAEAGVSTRQVHLRIFRDDETEEATKEVDLSSGYCFAEVGRPGSSYRCELGCFEGDEWKSLARSAAVATPEAGLSEDVSAEFANLPLHLSFQRMLDMLGPAETDRTRLAISAARSAAFLEMPGARHAERQWPAQMQMHWMRLAERFAGSSWAGGSNSPGSSRA